VTKTQAQKIQPRWLNPQQCADYLGLSVKAVRERAHKRKLPFSRLGYSLRFDKDQLDQLLQANAVEPSTIPNRKGDPNVQREG